MAKDGTLALMLINIAHTLTQTSLNTEELTLGKLPLVNLI
jgi:hypothetical protein